MTAGKSDKTLHFRPDAAVEEVLKSIPGTTSDKISKLLATGARAYRDPVQIRRRADELFEEGLRLYIEAEGLEQFKAAEAQELALIRERLKRLPSIEDDAMFRAGEIINAYRLQLAEASAAEAKRAVIVKMTERTKQFRVKDIDLLRYKAMGMPNIKLEPLGK